MPVVLSGDRISQKDEGRDAVFHCGEHERERLGTFSECLILLWPAFFHVDRCGAKSWPTCNGKLVRSALNSIDFSYCCLCQFVGREFRGAVIKYPNRCVRYGEATICPDLAVFRVSLLIRDQTISAVSGVRTTTTIVPKAGVLA